ncbi:MAG: hypothetical protein IPI11_05315 [Haliscomenobacter sp.]|nr:hypothetical protein [Haliscomenobacter sp.]
MKGLFRRKSCCPQRLIYGSYPGVVTTIGLSDKRELLNNASQRLPLRLAPVRRHPEIQKIVEILSLLASNQRH